MASTYVWPTAFEMFAINSDLTARSRADRIGLSLFPDQTAKAFEVRWWQKDNAYGLMAMRGIDGRPGPVQRVGLNEFVHKPGVYGEWTTVTEGELLLRADPTNVNQVMNVTDIVMDSARLLAQRREDRKEANIWVLLSLGTLSINLTGPTGPPAYTVTFPIQTYSAPISWSSLSTATPIINLQTVQQLSVGHGGRFGAEATMYMNQVTANLLINNSNAADFGGRRDMYGATLNNIGAMSSYFQSQNLPKVVIYDDGYQNQPVSGVITNPLTQFTKFIPDRKIILVGKRPNNEPLGHMHLCPSMNNPGNAAAPYSFVKNYGLGINAPQEVPARLEIHDGWNGGVALEYPSAFVSISV